MNPQTAPIQHFGDMPTEEFRQHGHALVDWIAAYRQNLDNIKVLPDVQPGSITAQLPKSAPEAPEAMTALLNDFERLIVPNLTQWHHPNFFAYFANSASLPAVLAEFLTAAINNNSMVWKSGQAATELEHVTLDWLRQALALPPEMWGMIFDTASISTMQAIACAREEAGVEAREKGLSGRTTPRLRVYASEFVHSSIDKACITLGLGAENLVKIPANERFQMIPEALEKAIADDREAGHLPICVVGVVGTTSVASSDPITAIAAICKREKIWLHVDAAYAGPVAMLPEWRGRFVGWEEADSIVINPHKWLLVPMDLSILYTRKPHVLKQAFSLTPEYLKTTEDALVENMMDYGIQLGRRFRSLKLWFVMRYFGIEGLQSRLREHIALARLFGDLVEAHPDFEPTAPVEFSLVCFRFRPQNPPSADEATREQLLERLNTELEERLNASGDIFLVHTKVHGVYTLRFAVGNMETTEKHVRRAFERIVAVAGMLGK
jgi:aromatic-L-amino-acid decarboxylase